MTASLSAANSNLPSPASYLSTLISASSNKGFSAKEMVALSDGLGLHLQTIWSVGADGLVGCVKLEGLVGSWPPCSDVLCCYFTIAMLFLGLLRVPHLGLGWLSSWDVFAAASAGLFGAAAATSLVYGCELF
ncbi:peroxidase [Sarracenia purpurea var. burkii]